MITEGVKLILSRNKYVRQVMHISSVVPRVEVTLSVKINFSYKDVEGILLYEDDQMVINL